MRKAYITINFPLRTVFAASQYRSTKYIKQILTDIKGEIDRNTIIVGEFNTPLTSRDRSSRQKINRATEILNDTIEQLGLIDIFRTIHQNKQNTHSLQVHIDHSVG